MPIWAFGPVPMGVFAMQTAYGKVRFGGGVSRVALLVAVSVALALSTGVPAFG